MPKLLTAIALAASIGLHWAFFQSVAWVGMVISYSQQAPLKEALIKTFDGKHPCSLCRQIAKERNQQPKSDRQFESKKLEFVTLARKPVLIPRSPFPKPGEADDWAPVRTQSPPVPPPRAA